MASEYNYLHHNVMGLTISRKWLPSSQCDGGNHFEKMVTLITSYIILRGDRPPSGDWCWGLVPPMAKKNCPPSES